MTAHRAAPPSRRRPRWRQRLARRWRWRGGGARRQRRAAPARPARVGPLGLLPVALLTGIYCPGCGGLRAVNDLTHGDLGAAASSNLLFVVAAPGGGAGCGSGRSRQRWRGPRAAADAAGGRRAAVGRAGRAAGRLLRWPATCRSGPGSPPEPAAEPSPLGVRGSCLPPAPSRSTRKAPMSVLDDIVAGVRTDLAEREAAVPAWPTCAPRSPTSTRRATRCPHLRAAGRRA